MQKAKDDSDPLIKAAKIIKKGGLVIFPTETVYGLGANAFNVEAVKKIFKAKKQPTNNPLIVHIADKKDLRKVVANVPLLAKELIDNFWPGPLTIIFKKRLEIPLELTAGLDTVAVRLPNHALARSLIREAGVPIAAPSANISGRPSATEAIHAKKDFNGKNIFILSAEKTRLGIESTVINILVKPPVILREGAVSREELEKVIRIIEIRDKRQEVGDFKIISPGMRHCHYAPKIKLVLPQGDWQNSPKEISSLIEKYQNKKKRVGVLGTRENYQFYKKANRVIVLGSKKNINTCASNLFKSLRDFDRFADVDIIIAETFPEKDLGTAVMDRLTRAAGL